MYEIVLTGTVATTRTETDRDRALQSWYDLQADATVTDCRVLVRRPIASRSFGYWWLGHAEAAVQSLDPVALAA